MNNRNYKPEEIKGLVYSNLFAFSVIGMTRLLSLHPGVFIYAEFVIIPFVMGIICSWFWRSLELKGARITALSVLNCTLAILLSAIFLGEGVICLIIVSPLIFGFVITGTFVGRAMFKKDNRNLNISVLSLLLFLFVADSLSKHHHEREVSDVVVINAPVKEVWKHVVSFERIEEKNKFWLFKVGMPSPVAATVDGYYEGAGRKCVFSNGYIFDEKIVQYKPGENLTFDIVKQPRDPEIMGHIDISRGQFILKDNGNGTTTLTGNSWYRLYVFPLWYYDIWAESITRNVHLRVMDHIKSLSEKR
ncbi:SRPBCC family protein [Desertivirga brevis]|uniref:SRPBCC family protein n=1 Tax=Desertivirga brevis TaxID=2810310 RepID=UPI001A96EE27|nr:SRPBCC family protein [Pedobacter sp. SYSU D00873]